ncbi:hypothetical protein [Parasphingorhabdus sp.]|uniref:hypothetical protein n=1 Tax=Parasphingorhabdus sp. TaxID=2709688 RepID=UPI003265FDA1
MRISKTHSGRSVAAIAFVALTCVGTQPVLAQQSSANAFADLFKKNNGNASDLERRGDQARQRRANTNSPDAPDFDGPEYRAHAADLAANSDLQELEQRGYDARRARPEQDIRTENDLTPAERRDLQRRGKNAQVARGVRPGFQNSGHPATQRTNRKVRRGAAQLPRGGNFNGPEYRQHVGNLAANGNLQQLEQRGYDARRARPGHQIRDEFDYTPEERRNLQQRGRQAQVTRGNRQGFRPVAGNGPQYQSRSVARGNHYPGAGRQPVRGQAARGYRAGTAARTGFTATSVHNKAAGVDFGTEAFGGRSSGIGEYGADMTVGQFGTFARGDDPVVAAGRATQRFGRNLNGAARGIGESIRDPRRIPGNVGRAVTGTARAGVSAVDYVGRTAVKTTRDGARFMTDPNYANRQINYGARKTAKTINNIGKSTCKGFSTLLGLNKKKCK